MTRIAPLTESSASPEGAQLLSAIKSKLGMVPNLYATIAHAPAALSATLAFGDALGKASISAPVREQLALAIAGVNTCDYCASAHTAIGKMNGLDESELNNNLNARASFHADASVFGFRRRVIEARADLGTRRSGELHVYVSGMSAARTLGQISHQGTAMNVVLDTHPGLHKERNVVSYSQSFSIAGFPINVSAGAAGKVGVQGLLVLGSQRVDGLNPQVEQPLGR